MSERESEPRASRNSALLALAKIRPGEEQKALAMFFYLFFSVGSFIVGRISRDTLFLTLPNAREVLPYMYIGIAIGVSVATTFYGRLQRRIPGQKLAGFALVFFAVTVAMMRLLLAQSTIWYWVYYVWVDVFGALMVIQCWSVANDIRRAPSQAPLRFRRRWRRGLEHRVRIWREATRGVVRRDQSRASRRVHDHGRVAVRALGLAGCVQRAWPT